MTIGERIKQIRIMRGYTRKELCQRCEIAIGTLYQYETNKRFPTFEILMDIANELDVKVDVLIDTVTRVKKSDLETSSKTLVSPDLKRLTQAFDLLNSEGKCEAIKRIEELKEIKRYTVNENDEK